MIFVTVGTNEAPFDRLLEAVAMLDTSEQIIVQCGSSRVGLPNAVVHRFMSFEAVNEFMTSARVVICHAGVGSTLVALGCGKRPIIVARRQMFGEAVDDHQVDFARRVGERALAVVAEPEHLDVVVRQEPPSTVGFAIQPPGAGIVDDLRQFIDDVIPASHVRRDSRVRLSRKRRWRTRDDVRTIEFYPLEQLNDPTDH